MNVSDSPGLFCVHRVYACGSLTRVTGNKCFESTAAINSLWYRREGSIPPVPVTNEPADSIRSLPPLHLKHQLCECRMVTVHGRHLASP